MRKQQSRKLMFWTTGDQNTRPTYTNYSNYTNTYSDQTSECSMMTSKCLSLSEMKRMSLDSNKHYSAYPSETRRLLIKYWIPLYDKGEWRKFSLDNHQQQPHQHLSSGKMAN